jgi:hypothetical protein
MTVTHTLSRVLGAAALAASLATAGAADASERQSAEIRTEPRPTYRMVEPADEPAPPALVARSPRHIESQVVTRRGKLVLRGDVESYYGRNVVVQRSHCDSCRWRRYDRVKTNYRGWFRSVIKAPRNGSTLWRAKVRAYGGYARSYSATWETYYRAS